MIQNYLKIALRNLLRNKVYSFINIGGLAVGMAVAMLIGLWIYDELSFNKYHQNYDKIGRAMQMQTLNGTTFTHQSMPFPMGEELKTKYGNNFKYLTMASWEGDHILAVGDKKLSKTGIYFDIEAPRMLSLKMLQGTNEGLKSPNSILLSETTAKAFFGEANPINQTMKIDNKQDVKVTGVYEDLPYNTEFKNLKFIAPWDLYVTSSEPWVRKAKEEKQWGNNSFQVYAQIVNNVDFETVNKRILRSKYNVVDKEEKKYNARIFMHPMKDWHLKSNWVEGVNTGGLIDYVWLFGIIGIFVLILACINFMNLSTARSEKRAKEVGVRKAIGSARLQLIAQFMSESMLVAFFALILSLLLVELVLPSFNEIADKKMTVLWNYPLFWLILVGFSLLTGLIAGSYPALYLSSFQPVKVLKGTFKVGRFASIPRKVLVIFQFTVSMALIIGTIIIYLQVQFSKDRPIGYDRDNLMMISMKTPEFNDKSEVLRNDLKASGAIVEFAQSSSPLTEIWSNTGGINWEGKDPNFDTDFGVINVTHEFGKTVGWNFKEGRDFSRAFSRDSLSVVINEAAVKFMGIKNPVGKNIWGNDKNAGFTIVGVIKDMLMGSPYKPVKQSIYFLNYKDVSWINLKLNPNKSASESIAKIGSIFKKHILSAPFEYKFADEEFAAKFKTEEQIGKLALFFAILAIFISCLGLFGLASFVAEQRTKEIGIRKVLGATVINLWTLLSKDFVFLVIISVIIATPIAYFFMNNWLQKYDYRTNISWWVFVFSGLGVLTITLLTVSYQAIKAALANPVKSLRTE
jgi:ABC-type antimicrobial peptide transport system permease subunit